MLNELYTFAEPVQVVPFSSLKWGKFTLLHTDGREYVVDFLAPGTYKYSGLDVTVPSAAAFGFHLDLGYTEARVAGYSTTSNGFARHYVWARDHVFMFDKE